ncbi:MAG: hypothetical protein KGM24_13720 [Elusimicrobia bacterium]|nr:hypothetical protein [Elusimicrobiota bacterium]
MRLRFHDPRAGAQRELVPAAAPAVGVEEAGTSPREAAVAASLRGALRFLGLEPRPGDEIRVGGEAPAPDRAWLKTGPAPGEPAPLPEALSARGFSLDDYRFLCLTARYREPLAFSWEALAAARAEREAFLSRAAEGAALAPSPRALAAYLLRFRARLEDDLDLPGALGCVRDALRPGALSPGSRAALLGRALPALGLAAPASRPSR